MNAITLNLRARLTGDSSNRRYGYKDKREVKADFKNAFPCRQWSRLLKKDIGQFIGIQTARKLVKNFKEDKLFPVVTRHSFSMISIAW